jgi:hypothetical protein
MALRREIQEFADIMEYKMAVHDDRGVLWKKSDQAYFLKRMKDEVAELEEKMKKGNIRNIQYECADVANFAMMLSWKVEDDWANECVARHERSEERKQMEER